MHSHARARGFSLIELAVVIVIAAILASLLVQTARGQAERARVARAQLDATYLANAAARMRFDTQSTNALCYTTLGNYVQSAAASATNCGVTTLCAAAQRGAQCWGGPYITTVPGADPWGTTYSITYDATNQRALVTSFGPNRVAGADDITAIQ